MLAVERASNVSNVVTRPATWACRIARNRTDRLEAFRLVYRRYVKTGLMEPNPFEIRVTPFHLLPSTNVFSAYAKGRIVGTVTLIADGSLGVPMDNTNPQLVERLRREGVSFGEVSCLAFEDMPISRFLSTFVAITRLMAQHARAGGMERFLVAVVPQHARFYERFMGFRQVDEPRPYDTVCGTVGVACELDFPRIDRERPACYDQFFGVTVPCHELESGPMSAHDVEYFRPAAEIGAALGAPSLAFA